MDILFWILVSILFLLSFVSLVYPILPGVLFLVGGFVLYGFLFSFEPLSVWFWVIQGIFVILLFVVDYVSNMYGVKKQGGSRAAVWGSIIGLIIGPIALQLVGIILGPFLGAFLAELLVHKKSLKEAGKVGIGTLLGFLGGAIVKAAMHVAMITIFVLWVIF